MSASTDIMIVRNHRTGLEITIKEPRKFFLMHRKKESFFVFDDLSGNKTSVCRERKKGYRDNMHIHLQNMFPNLKYINTLLVTLICDNREKWDILLPNIQRIIVACETNTKKISLLMRLCQNNGLPRSDIVTYDTLESNKFVDKVLSFQEIPLDIVKIIAIYSLPLETMRVGAFEIL
jgi:hypothetical protein